MKTIIDIKEANILLQFYIGATLQKEMYSTSLKRMALRLVLPNVKEVLYVIGIGCESLNGRFGFTNANLNITVDVINEKFEPITIIADKLVEFSLVTSGGFSLAQGIESEFGTSFENILVDKE